MFLIISALSEAVSTLLFGGDEEAEINAPAVDDEEVASAFGDDKILFTAKVYPRINAPVEMVTTAPTPSTLPLSLFLLGDTIV